MNTIAFHFVSTRSERKESITSVAVSRLCTISTLILIHDGPLTYLFGSIPRSTLNVTRLSVPEREIPDTLPE